MSKRGENIYKRKDGRWEGRYIKTHIGSKIKYGYIYGKTYSSVKQKLVEKKMEKETMENKKEHKTVTYGELSKMWIESCQSAWKESTKVKYENMLIHYVIPYLGDCPINKISSESITRMCDELSTHGAKQGNGLSPKTISGILSLLKRIRKFAISEHYSLSFDVENRKFNQDKKEFRIFNIREQSLFYEFLLEHMDPCNLGILLCLFTGIRIGELCALRWGDISTENKTIHIDKTMFRIQTNNRETKTKILITSPKSLCSVRSIPVQDIILKLLLQYQSSDETYLLTGLKEKYMEPRAVQYRYKKILEKCGIADANFHALRHTFATRCVEAGCDIKSLSEILGHSSVNITLNRYVHPSMDLKRDNMNKLSEFLTVK